MNVLIILIFQVTSIEVAINGGNKASEKEFLVLTELLMSQLLKLDGIEAEGEAKLQRKAEVVFMILQLQSWILKYMSVIVVFSHSISCNLMYWSVMPNNVP